MPFSLNRRTFLRSATAVSGALFVGAGGNWAVASADENADWTFPLLGDLHFDRPEHHDHEWLAQTHPNDVEQVRNYTRLTHESLPPLLAAIRERIATTDLPVPFIVQVGDLVEGLCGSEPLAARQADDAIAFLRETNLSAPFLFTKGNHDIAGPGASEVYDRKFVPFMAEQAGNEIASPAFTRERGGTLLVFYDAYDRRSLDWFEKLMADRRPRRLLFVIHPPVVPYNARSDWHVYPKPEHAENRRRLLNLLGAANAIVLSGHLHKYCLLTRRTETGRFTQLALSSVAKDAQAEPRDLREGIDAYGPDLLDLEPRHAPETIDRRRALLTAERPFIDRYEYADTWGNALIRIEGDSVTAEVHRGLDPTPWKRLDLASG